MIAKDIDYKKLDKFEKEFRSVYPLRTSDFSKEFIAYMKEFENFVFDLHRHKECKPSQFIPQRSIKFLRKFFDSYETLLEKQKALELINHKCDQNNVLYKDRVLHRTFDYARAEGKMMQLQKTDNVLVIGSGPFPETALGYARYFGCNVTCLERKSEFVEISKKVIKEFGLQNKIKVVHGKSVKSYGLRRFTKILITALSKPKSRILNELIQTNVPIALRTALGSSELVYEPVNPELLINFKIQKRLIRWNKNFTSSLLLLSKGYENPEF